MQKRKEVFFKRLRRIAANLEPEKQMTSDKIVENLAKEYKRHYKDKSHLYPLFLKACVEMGCIAIENDCSLRVAEELPPPDMEERYVKGLIRKAIEKKGNGMETSVFVKAAHLCPDYAYAVSGILEKFRRDGKLERRARANRGRTYLVTDQEYFMKI